MDTVRRMSKRKLLKNKRARGDSNSRPSDSKKTGRSGGPLGVILSIWDRTRRTGTNREQESVMPPDTAWTHPRQSLPLGGNGRIWPTFGPLLSFYGVIRIKGRVDTPLATGRKPRRFRLGYPFPNIGDEIGLEHRDRRMLIRLYGLMLLRRVLRGLQNRM